jgi:carbon monoxide dehydrogenase subunit G
MKVEGTKDFDAPAQIVWETLNDPSKMAKLLPGVESFDVADDRHWSAAVKIPLGMGGLKLNFNFEKVEERPIEYAKLSSKGQGVGAIVAMETEFHLTADGDRTKMRWEADVRVAGPIGSMGQRVFQPIVNQQVTNVLNALEAQVSEARDSTAGGGGSTGAEEGIHPASPETYSAEPEGPTHSAA